MERAAAPYGLPQWVEYLSDRPLPVLAPTLQALRERLKDPELSLNQLVPLVQRDPVLNLHLVRQANALNRNKETGVNTADLTLSTLGLDHLKTLCETLPVMQFNAASVPHKQYAHALGNSYHAWVQAGALCRFTSPSVIADTRTAALFYGVGHWALWRYAPLQMSAIKARIYEAQEDMVLAEDDILGCTIQQISEALVRAWGVSELAVEALRHATSPDADMLALLHRHAEAGDEMDEPELRAIKQLLNAPFYPVKLANWLALTVPYGWQEPKALRLQAIIADFLHAPLDTVISDLHSRCAQASREHRIDGVMTPAAQLLLLPSELVLNYRLSPSGGRPRVRGMERLSTLRAEQAARHPAPAASQEPPLTAPADPQLFRRITDALAAAERADASAESVYQDLLSGLHQGLGLSRVSLMEVTAGLELRPLCQAGMLPDAPLARFTFNLEIPSLFKQLSRKPSLIWVGSHNQAQLWPQLPERFKRICHPRSFVLISLFRKGKPQAYLYGDAGPEASLSGKQVLDFKEICSAANRALNQLTP
ncbi:HDOD domain-containing protein [Motiliproteus sp. SC1-56]|uniref:HDOD domain-containing protein n=1 Tax=Motiliproteus sp. SC1-56 TaxID=2799565 RepID=UPI001A8FA0A9|nr:HDOD domain-containing protein [Motiliproteus sp. SC1-56]